MNATQREIQSAIHGELFRCLTAVQARRVVAYYGMDGKPGMTEREIAEQEGVALRAVQDSLALGLAKLRNNAHLWAMWLMLNAPQLRVSREECAYCRGYCTQMVSHREAA